MSRGLEATGYFRTDLFCEAATFPVSVLRKHWPGTPIHGDITTLSTETLLWHGVEPDVVCGGFPCQDLSIANPNGEGLAGKRSGLWFEMLRVIDETKPKYAVIENVTRLRGKGLDVVLGGLASIGYDAEWHCVTAAAVGAPHRRDRIWILAYPNDGGRRVEGHERGQNGGAGAGQSGVGGQAVAYPGGQGLPGAEQAGWPVPLITPAVLWGTATQCRWRRLEPGMGGTDVRFSAWLDRPDSGLTEAHQLLQNYATSAQTRPAEILRILQRDAVPEEVQRPAGGLSSLHAKTVLFDFLCKLEERDGVAVGLSLESEKATETGVRGLRNDHSAAGTPHGRRPVEQLARQHPDSLQALSRLLALRASETWLAYSRSNAPAPRNRYPVAVEPWEGDTPRTVGRGYPDRRQRLMSLGNSLVPAIAEMIGRAIIMKEESL